VATINGIASFTDLQIGPSPTVRLSLLFTSDKGCTSSGAICTPISSRQFDIAGAVSSLQVVTRPSSGKHVCVYVYMCVCVCMYVNAFVQPFIHTHKSSCRSRVEVHPLAVHVHTQHIYIHTHIHTYIHTHIQLP
jgi:hypothetical protein